MSLILGGVLTLGEMLLMMEGLLVGVLSQVPLFVILYSTVLLQTLYLEL